MEVSRNGRGTGGSSRAWATGCRTEEHLQESDETTGSENARMLSA